MRLCEGRCCSWRGKRAARSCSRLQGCFLHRAGCCKRPEPSLHPQGLVGVCLTTVTGRNLRKGQGKERLGAIDDLIAGLVAGVPAAFFTCPLDVIKTRMQSCGVVSHVLVAYRPPRLPALVLDVQVCWCRASADPTVGASLLRIPSRRAWLTTRMRAWQDANGCRIAVGSYRSVCH